MRVAVVDIGSNSTRLLVADVDSVGRVEELDRDSRVTRLGTGVNATGALSEEAIARVLNALDGYKQRIDAQHAEAAVAVLTSAVRDASNGADFLAQVRQRYALDARTIDGDEEAQLTFLGATSERDPDDTTELLVVNIGGGSTELVLGRGHEVYFHVSTQAGVVRQTERHLHDDPPTSEQMDQLGNDTGRSSPTPSPNRTAAPPRPRSRSPAPPRHARRSSWRLTRTTPPESRVTGSGATNFSSYLPASQSSPWRSAARSSACTRTARRRSSPAS